MRFLHIGDLHAGKAVCGFSLLEDQRYALSRVLAIAKEREAQALVLAGDLYDKSAPSAEAVSLIDWFLTQAANEGLTVLGIPGNHDSAERVAYASGLMASRSVHFPAVYDGRIPYVQLEDEHGKLAFWLAPFLKPVHVRGFFPNEEIGQDYTAAMRAALSTCELDPDVRNVAVAHQFVTVGAHAPDTCDSELNLGGLDNVDGSVFDGFDYVALGHVHRPQRIGRDTMRYAGSLLKYSFSEIPYPKSVCLVDMGPKGQVDIELVAIEPLRDMREVRGPLEAILAEDVLAQGNCEDYVHVVLTDEEPPLDAIARVRAAFPHVMAIDYDNTRTRHASAITHDAQALQALNPLELFARFYEEQNGVALNDGQEALVRQLLEESGCMEGGAK